MIDTNLIEPLRQRLQNCGSSLTASDFKELLDVLEVLENNINDLILNFVSEAPKDGIKYARLNGVWVPIDYNGPLLGSFDESYNDDFDR